jgi:hypothetical protein
MLSRTEVDMQRRPHRTCCGAVARCRTGNGHGNHGAGRSIPAAVWYPSGTAAESHSRSRSSSGGQDVSVRPSIGHTVYTASPLRPAPRLDGYRWHWWIPVSCPADTARPALTVKIWQILYRELLVDYSEHPFPEAVTIFLNYYCLLKLSSLYKNRTETSPEVSALFATFYFCTSKDMIKKRIV